MHIRISKNKWQSTIAVIILFLLSSGGLYVFQIGRTPITIYYLVSIIPITRWFFKRKKLSNFYNGLLIWTTVSIIISIIQFRNVELLSILHFVFYVLTGIVILTTYIINENVIKKTAKLLIYANLVNIIIAITLNSLGLSNLPPIFGTCFDRGVIRYMGFTSEPSYLAMESSVCMLAVLRLKGERNDWKLLIAYILTILLAQTTFGLMSIAFIGYAWFRSSVGKRQSAPRVVLIVALLIVLCLFAGFGIMYFTEGDFLTRLFQIFDVIGDSRSLQEFEYSLRRVDSSAWSRVGPMILALAEANVFKLSTWFGHGIGADGAYYGNLLGFQQIVHGGFLQAGLYNQGIIGLSAFLYMVIKECMTMGKMNLLYMILCFTNCSVSTQAFWFILIIYISTSRVLEERYS